MDSGERRRLIQGGADAFNRGEFFEAHELWEAVWLSLAEPERKWVQGMIQIAAGLHKLAPKGVEVTRRLVARGLEKLERCPNAFEGLDLASFKRDVASVLVALEAGGHFEISPLRGVDQAPD